MLDATRETASPGGSTESLDSDFPEDFRAVYKIAEDGEERILDGDIVSGYVKSISQEGDPRIVSIKLGEDDGLNENYTIYDLLPEEVEILRRTQREQDMGSKVEIEVCPEGYGIQMHINPEQVLSFYNTLNEDTACYQRQEDSYLTEENKHIADYNHRVNMQRVSDGKRSHRYYPLPFMKKSSNVGRNPSDLPSPWNPPRYEPGSPLGTIIEESSMTIDAPEHLVLAARSTGYDKSLKMRSR